MIGVVLAAGDGRRAQLLSAGLPTPLLPVRDDTTILDLVLGNLRAVDVVEILLVVGHDGDRIVRLVDRLETRHGVRITPVVNGGAGPGSTARSLYCARDAFAEGCLVVSADSVHPGGVERALVDRRAGAGPVPRDRREGAARPELLFAVDGRGNHVAAGPGALPGRDGGAPADGADTAGDTAPADGAVRDPRSLGGRGYVGVSLVEPGAGPRLTEALRTVLERVTPGSCEDGFQQFVDGGGRALAVDVGAVEWVRVGDRSDLARARAIACRF